MSAASDLVVLDTPYVMVGDVLDIQGGDAAATDALSRMRLAKLVEGVEREFDRDQIESLLVARVPGLRGRMSASDISSQRFLYKSETDDRDTCIVSTIDLKAGEVLMRRDAVVSSNCPEESVKLNFASSVNAYSPIEDAPKGSRLPVKSLSALPVASTEQDFTFVTRVGPVQISRPVTLLNAVYDDGAALALTSDGTVVKAKLDDLHAAHEEGGGR